MDEKVIIALISSVCTVGFVGAIAAAYCRIYNVRFKATDKRSTDSLGVMREVLDRMTKEYNESRAEIKQLQEECSQRKDKETACQIEQERQAYEIEYLRKEVEQLKTQLTQLKGSQP